MLGPMYRVDGRGCQIQYTSLGWLSEFCLTLHSRYAEFYLCASEPVIAEHYEHLYVVASLTAELLRVDPQIPPPILADSIHWSRSYVSARTAGWTDKSSK